MEQGLRNCTNVTLMVESYSLLIVFLTQNP